MSWVYICGVELGRRALLDQCLLDNPPLAIVQYDQSLSYRSGYADFGDIGRNFKILMIHTRSLRSDPGAVDALSELRPSLAVVGGWSELIPSSIRSLFDKGAFGMHPTDLPIGRGRAPIPWTVLNGVSKTAVSLFRLVDEADAGPIVDKVHLTVSPDETSTTLYDRVALAQSLLLRRNLGALEDGSAKYAPQVGVGSYYRKRSPGDGLIDWSASSEHVVKIVRALSRPYPGARTRWNDRFLTIWQAKAVAGDEGLAVGQAGIRDGELLVGCGRGAVMLGEVELSGMVYRPAHRLVTLGYIREFGGRFV